MSQFEDLAIAANIEERMERAGLVFSQALSSNRIFLAAKNGGSRVDFLP
jgi:DNA segregation ATPase FtsK/SpoIIIE-like protein